MTVKDQQLKWYLYTALDKIKETKKEDPLKVFNTAIK